jgi:hypothetical protein
MMAQQKKTEFVINYRLEGSFYVEAASPEEAQMILDKEVAKGLPHFLNDAEFSNGKPKKNKSGRRGDD